MIGGLATSTAAMSKLGLSTCMCVVENQLCARVIVLSPYVINYLRSLEPGSDSLCFFIIIFHPPLTQLLFIGMLYQIFFRSQGLG